ncbi:NlpC/P60 family protein [Streptomyces sp. NPDC056773]|uniref:NlpC/P60 family protein n=1 Tax=unclassified Streptomyces TaxID=2593676 RepID=UPI00368C9C41
MRPVINTSRRTLLAALTASAAAPLTGLTASPASAAPASLPAAVPEGLNAAPLASSGLGGPQSAMTLTGPSHDIAALTRASVGALTRAVLPGSPARTEVRCEGRPVAVLTTGARTVLMTGPERTFTEDKRTVTDLFERALKADGTWGNSPEGGEWSVFGGAAAATPEGLVYTDFKLREAGAGLMVLDAGFQGQNEGRYATVVDDEITDVDVECTGRFSEVPQGNACSLALVFAYQNRPGGGDSTHYRARVSFTTSGGTELRLEKVLNGNAVRLGAVVPLAAGGVAPNTDWTIRVRREGSRIRIKSWAAAAGEPAAWDMEFTDPETDPAKKALYAKGRVGLRGGASDGCSNLPIEMSVSRFAVRDATWEKPPSVTHSHWVRLLDTSYDGTWTPAVEAAVRGWAGSLAPDALSYAAMFLPGAPQVTSGWKQPVGAQVFGKAGYGKTDEEGVRQVGADFHEYMGQPWQFPDRAGLKTAEAGQVGNVDCSGYVRMVYGYHMGVPVYEGGVTSKKGLPRFSGAMVEEAPGARIAAKGADGKALAANVAIQPGDLVLFDANAPKAGDDYTVDHVGIYLGTDADGLRRFVSSRKSCNGPTMADVSGPSLLDGSGEYALSLRTVHRI